MVLHVGVCVCVCVMLIIYYNRISSFFNFTAKVSGAKSCIVFFLNVNVFDFDVGVILVVVNSVFMARFFGCR